MTTESLRILVDQAKSYLDRQWDAFDSQDRKIAGLFSVATALVTVIPAFVTATGAEITRWQASPFIAAAGVYAASLYLHWNAYRPSEVHTIGNARAYHEEWVEFELEEVLRWTILDIAIQQDANTEKLYAKERGMRAAAVAVAAEAVLLAFGALFVAA